MYKLKVHALYDHFPALTPQDGDKYIDCYCDNNVRECIQPGKNIAMLLEPKSMIGGAYDYVKNHADLFRYIFTHDSDLLELPHAYLLNWADVWLTTDSEKTEGISLITSPKNWCPLHNARLELYKMFINNPKVDCFYGDWNNPKVKNIEARDYLEHYKFSIIIENDIDPNWYTEKIMNCFSTKTVPIYYGATKILDIFNSDGIIFVDNWKDIPQIVDNLDIDTEYTKRLEAIEYNFHRVDHWKTPWKQRFFDTYGDLFERLCNE